jgi:hypothetical protein
MNKIKLIFLLIISFVLINIIIVILWPIKTNLKHSDYNYYSDKFLKSLELNKTEGRKLYLETWQRERLFEFDEYTGLRESELLNGAYVNITKENGRLVPDNRKQCQQNVFFYGGEIVFGYDVTDRQTIPSFFSNLLKINNKKNCVYNFGRKTYFSTQENILFQKHILNNKINKNDIIVFINGTNEQGNKTLINTEFIETNYNNLHQKYWKLYKVGIKYFLDLLPITQFIQILNNKLETKGINSNIEESKKLNNEVEIFNVYNKNLKIRKAICKQYNLRCFNFLLIESEKDRYNKIYEKFMTIDEVLDLNETLTLKLNEQGSLYPESNKKISEKIYRNIFN